MVYIRKHVRKGKTYYSVVEAFRENDKVRQRIVHYIGSEKEYRLFLDTAVNVSGFASESLENLLYQAPATLWKLMEQMEIRQTISMHFSKKWGVDAATAACVMILNYATDRRSKCRIGDWYSQTYLPHLLGIPPEKLNKDLLCRTMDMFTEENIAEMHAEVFGKAKKLYGLSDDMFFYDTAAVTFEGSQCGIAGRGYNAAHSYNLQVNLGMGVTKERFPMMHRVFEGETKDVMTLEKIIPPMEKSGSLEKAVFVFDRGISSTDNCNLIKSKGAFFICGLPRSRTILALIKALKAESFTAIDEDISFHETTKGDDSLIIYWSRKLEEDNRKLREKRIKKIMKKLSSLSKNIKRYERRKERLHEKIGEICGSYRKFFLIDTKNGMKFALKQDQLDLAYATEGRYAILTNTALLPEEVLQKYRDRNFIEMSFRDMKLFIDIRPVRHWKDNRVLAHIFLAVLAFAVRMIAELKMKRAEMPLTAEEALLQLNKVRALVASGKLLKITGKTKETDKIVSVIEG